ncbi:MAG: hypothetical protein ABEH66_06055 [Halobacteriales archaeon]
MAPDWPRQIEGHLIDRETNVQVGRGAEVEEQFYCVDCGRTFEDEPDPDVLVGVPCNPSPSDEIP